LQESRQQTLESLYSTSELKQLKKDGVVLLDLVPERDGWLFNEVIVKLSRRDGEWLPRNKCVTSSLVAAHSQSTFTRHTWTAT
jgi:hypothetical protein